jgi:hypothetical protein
MNGDEDLGEDITMKGDKFHFVQNVQLSAEPAAATTVKADYPPPEKVHTLDPKIAKAHTTFYNKLGQQGQYSYNQMYRQGADISEAVDSVTTAGKKSNGINEDVHDFVHGNVERLAWPRSEDAFVPNGSKVTFDAPAGLYQRYGRDISEAVDSVTTAGKKSNGIDEDVHGFANKNVERLAWPRSEEAFIPNGS